METQNQNSKTTEMFLLSAENFDDQNFYVVKFNGYEALNELFNFSIDFVCKNKSLNTNILMSSLTTFTIIRKDGETSNFTGYPINIEQAGHFGDYAYYHIDLRPTFWKMTQLYCSRIFLNKNIKDIIKEILSDEQFLNFTHEFNFIKNDYPQPEFVMQYNENNFDFITWNLEQNGAYFYFDQDNSDANNIKDKLVFCDQPNSHNSLNNNKLIYTEISGLDFNSREEIIYSFKLKQSPLPKNIVVRDYNWKKPNQVIIGNANVSENGLGTIYLSNENVENENDANRIAKIRAEELQCHSKTYYGKSVIPTLRPGFTFELTQHYNNNFNQEYLLTKVSHEGNQESFLTLGLGIPMQKFKKFSQNLVENIEDFQDNHYYYHNNFECIEANQVYHPKRTAPRAEIKGVIRGFIDGAGDASRPEVDEFGRYKVIFPFDISGRDKGKGSCWIRRSQEQIGQGNGLNFPLLGGVEVTISFINGNPNLPIISGALANGETQSLAKNTNNNTEGIYTAGGNKLLFNNTDKKQGFALQTAAGRGMVVGAGSLTSTQKNTDYDLGITNAITTNINGMAASQLTGMKNVDIVYSPPSFTNVKDTSVGWIVALVPTLLQTAKDITANIYNSTDNENCKFASETLKALQVTVETLITKLLTPKSDYSATLKTGKDIAFSKLEALPFAKSDIIAWASTMLGTSLLDTIKSAYDDASGKTENEYENAKNDYQEALEKYNQDPSAYNYEDLNKKLAKYSEAKESYDNIKTKKATAFKYVNSTLAELLPEIISLIFICQHKGGLDKRRLGGVLLNSENANITLAARDPIALHTARGVLVNTEDISIKNKKLNDSNNESTETFKGYDDTLNPLNKGNYLKWGVADKNGKLPKDYTEGNESFTADEDNQGSLTGFLQKSIKEFNNKAALKPNYFDEDAKNVMKHRFIANQTQHIINLANYGTDLFYGQKYNIAYSFVFSTKPDNSDTNGKGITQLRMNSKGDNNALNIQGYQPGKTGFIVDTFNAVEKEHSITLRTHTNDSASNDNANYQQPSSWLNLSKNIAELSVAKDGNQKQMVKTTNDKILLGITTENNSDVNSIDKIKSGAVIDAEKLTIKIGEQNITIDSNGIHLISNKGINVNNKVTIDKDGVIVAEKYKTSSGIVDLAGAIKVMQGDISKLIYLK